MHSIHGFSRASFLGYVSGLTGDFPGGFWQLVHGWL